MGRSRRGEGHYDVIAFDNAAVVLSAVTGNGSAAFSVGAQGKRLLIVGTIASADGVSNVTYGGVAMTKLGSSVQNSVNANWNTFWYLLNPATGSNTLAVTCPDTYFALAASYSGVKQQAPEASNSGTTAALTVTTVAYSSWAIIFTGADDATPNAGADTTARVTDGIGVILGDNNGPKVPPGNVTLAIEVSTGTAFAGIIAAFAPAEPNLLAVF